MNLEEIAAAIKEKPIKRRPVLIAIEGYGGSGKTTFANKLKDALINAYVINFDDFIIKERILEQSAKQAGFDRTRLEQQVLLPAYSGQSVAYQRLEWVKNELSEPIRIPKINYLMIEGISSYHPEIAKYYDYKIWVDVPIDVAKQRGKQRDAGNENEQHWELWAANDIAYQEKYRPEQQANFIYDSSK